MAAEVKEGFLCPICMADLGDVIQLQVHFDEKHSKEDPAFVQSLKEFFGKAKEKIKKGIDEQLQGGDSTSELGALLNRSGAAVSSETTEKINVFGTEYEASVHPVSGIRNEYLENSEKENHLPCFDQTEFFKAERTKRADMTAMDTNKLIIRLERLLTNLPHEPGKRRNHEQAVVSWIPENMVKLCPTCTKSFNLTRRKHHCRICGSIMCNDCSDYIAFDFAKKLINPNARDDEERENEDGFTVVPSGSKLKSPSMDEIVSNLMDFTGLSESQRQFRCCTFCKDSLAKREARVALKSLQPKIVFYYEKLHSLMSEGGKMSDEFRETAERFNAGEPATKLQLEEANFLRNKVCKMAETLQILAKRISTLEVDPEEIPDPVARASYNTLKSRISVATINFIKECLVGLPKIPTEEELMALQAKRKEQAAKRIEEEKKSAEIAKQKYEQEAQRRQQMSNLLPVSLNTSLGSSPRPKTKSPQKSKPKVKYSSGFVSSVSRDNYVSSDDPIVQQMANLREFIGQARAAGKLDDARLLEENLRDLQEEFQKQRRELEGNYDEFKHLFSKNTPSKEDSDDGQLDQSNPFFVDEDEMREIESSLGNGSNSFSDKMLEEDEEKTIVDGREDFDEYDKSGKNPFF